MAFFQRKRFSAGAGRKKPVPDGVWMKCPKCAATLYRNDFEENGSVCASCGYHARIGARRRIDITVDPGSFAERHSFVQTTDPLGFAVGEESYIQRVGRAQRESGLSEALLGGYAAIEGTRIVIGAMDAHFIMASMGSALGERFCRLADDALTARVPLVLFAASGGARMQEGILALMQMAKTANAVRALNEGGIPYISVLTDPTSGGVYASFASLGDIVLAEPEAYIGFAGARLIQGALKVKLPEGFQRAEYQFQNGFIDEILPRTEIRPYLARAVRYLTPQQGEAEAPAADAQGVDAEVADAEAPGDADAESAEAPAPASGSGPQSAD